MKNLKVMTALGLLTLCLPSFAATTGNLILRGKIQDILSIKVKAEADATTLDLATDQTDLKVASVQEKSNSASGYNVSIESANDGQLLRDGGTEVFPYTMKYDGEAVDLSTISSFSNSASAAVSVNKDVTISYSGQGVEDMIAGDYEDTVTFSISLN